MRRLLSQFLLLSFAFIGAVTVLYHGYFWWRERGHMPEEMSVQDDLSSPDAAHRAIVFTEAGGGGISPFCSELVSVVRAGISEQAAWPSSNWVFSGNCGSLNHVSWQSKDRLLISLNRSLAQRGNNGLSLEGFGDGLKVMVLYDFYP
ncbi:hypothetical protein AB4Z52_32565 [Rhizobium sp. 2YAF20]|uniref:hypothetical protein n=1 Tax=Rhizobium sp. 2YAF20 TaxID=3233027 RepID=UPI003F963CCA